MVYLFKRELIFADFSLILKKIPETILFLYAIQNEKITMSSYVIISDDHENALRIQSLAEDFPNLVFSGYAYNYADGLNIVAEQQPDLVFLEITPKLKTSRLSLALINEFHRYLKSVPKVIVTAKNKNFAYEAIKHEAFDYLEAPYDSNDFRKAILKFEKSQIIATQNINSDKLANHKDNLTICIKSYGDYKFIYALDILYLQADSNSTDIYLNNGDMITAFKTLKHFEKVLPPQFYRIHNSFIVNKDYISRIHTGNSVCFLKNSKTKLPFSKSYRPNVEQIIASISSSDYLEI